MTSSARITGPYANLSTAISRSNFPNRSPISRSTFPIRSPNSDPLAQLALHLLDPLAQFVPQFPQVLLRCKLAGNRNRAGRRLGLLFGSSGFDQRIVNLRDHQAYRSPSSPERPAVSAPGAEWNLNGNPVLAVRANGGRLDSGGSVGLSRSWFRAPIGCPVRMLPQAASLHFSPRGEAKCVRGPSGRGASRLARAGVLEQYVEHGKQAQRSPGGRIACFDRRVVKNAG